MLKALPFVFGVIIGKQFIIWPLGFGLIGFVAQVPILFTTLKILSAIYILWLSYKIANTRITIKGLPENPPGFFSGLIVHPLNPKAWGMIVTGYTSFINSQVSTLSAILIISFTLMSMQIILHPLWCWGGQSLASIVRDKVYEKYFSFSDFEKYLIPNNFRFSAIQTHNNNLFSGAIFFAIALYLNKNKYEL